MCLCDQDYLSASSDLQEVLQLDPKVREAEQELEVVTGLLRQSLMDNSAHTTRVGALFIGYTQPLVLFEVASYEVKLNEAF